MKSASDRLKRKSLLLIMGTTALLLCLEVSRADVLYWATSQLSTNSFASGYGFAEKTLRLKGAQNIRVSADEVTGSIGRTYVVITLVGTTPKVTAVIMAVGPDRNETAGVRDEVRNFITNIGVSIPDGWRDRVGRATIYATDALNLDEIKCVM
jgi:hypothetical protein